MQCAIRNRLEIAKLLIQANANLDLQDNFSNSALLNCTSYINNVEVAKILLDAGANPNLVNDNRRTALIECAIDSRTEIARLLIDAKADLNIRGTGVNVTAL
jgi:uncharacterized protein